MRARPGDVLFRIADHQYGLGSGRRCRTRSGGRVREPGGDGAGAQLSGPNVRRKSRAGLSASQSGHPHRARPDRTPQYRFAPSPRHVRGGRDQHRQRRAGAGRAGQRGDRQRQPPDRAGRQRRRTLRAAPGQARSARDRLRRDPRRARRRRGRRHLRQLPDRRREQSQIGAQGPERRERRRNDRTTHRALPPATSCWC